MQTRTYADEGLKYLFERVNELLRNASEYNGIVYGGYVRDVVSKVVRYDFSATEVKDVDIWFREERDREQFIDDALRRGFIKRNNGGGPPNSAGADDVQCYLLVDSFGDTLLWVDLTVSQTHPVNDFDVNFLSWNPIIDKLTSLSYLGVTEILRSIQAKQAELTEDYYYLLFSERSWKAQTARMRVLSRFLTKGWTLTFQGKVLVIEVELENGKFVKPGKLGNERIKMFSLLNGFSEK